MTTKLEKALRREVTISREPWVVTITPTGLKLTRKGRRKGLELEWKSLVSGDAALAVALNASLRESSRRGMNAKEKLRGSKPKPRTTRTASR
jgi:hypothetical protein